MAYALYYSAAFIAIVSTMLVVAALNPVHALLYLVVSLLATAVLFYLMGAFYVAMLQVIIHAGAIIMLFLFVVMMLNLGRESLEQERKWLHPSAWRWPAAMAAVLLTELLYVLTQERGPPLGHIVTAKDVGIGLLGPYVVAVELASMLLLAGLVGAYHLTRSEARP